MGKDINYIPQIRDKDCAHKTIIKFLLLSGFWLFLLNQDPISIFFIFSVTVIFISLAVLENYFFNLIKIEVNYLDLWVLLKLFIFYWNSNLLVTVIFNNKIIFKNNKLIRSFSSLSDQKLLEYFNLFIYMKVKNNIFLNNQLYKIYYEIFLLIIKSVTMLFENK